MDPRYLHMIKKMASEGPIDWSVYVLRCGDGSLYTGITRDIGARLAQHNAGKGAAYTRTHRPVQLIYSEANYTHSQALVREAEIKRLSRPRKELLVAGQNN